MGAIWEEPGDKFRLVLNYRTVSFLACLKFVPRLMGSGYIADGLDRTRYPAIRIIQGRCNKPEVGTFSP